MGPEVVESLAMGWKVTRAENVEHEVVGQDEFTRFISSMIISPLIRGYEAFI